MWKFFLGKSFSSFFILSFFRSFILFFCTIEFHSITEWRSWVNGHISDKLHFAWQYFFRFHGVVDWVLKKVAFNRKCRLVLGFAGISRWSGNFHWLCTKADGGGCGNGRPVVQCWKCDTRKTLLQIYKLFYVYICGLMYRYSCEYMLVE